jgi:hypothetical protein
MAERWVAFAKTGNPNYDGSKIEWIPWRYIPTDDPPNKKESEDYMPLWEQEEFAFPFPSLPPAGKHLKCSHTSS